MNTPPSNIRCRPMKRWQSHKIVQADKITKIEVEESNGTVTITMGDEPDAPVVVTSTIAAVEGGITWYAKHQPKVGDYVVIYQDGYMSVSPAQAFEEGYSQLTDSAPDSTPCAKAGLSFGDALKALKSGQRVIRAGWNGKGMWLELQAPDEHSKMTPPIIYIQYPKGHPASPSGLRTLWVPSQAEVLAQDWCVL